MGSLIQRLSKDITRTGVPAPVAEKVMREFWNTLQEALLSEGVVKVKGLGTFKLIDVKDRESINVTNGERIVIPGYRKVSFSPDPTFTERTNEVESSTVPVASESAELFDEDSDAPVIIDLDSTEPADETPVEAALTAQGKIQTLVEQPSEQPEIEENTEEGLEIVTSENQDTFSGIDLLIPTPESIADAEKECEEAKAELEQVKAMLREKEDNYRKSFRKLAFLRTGKVTNPTPEPQGEQPELEEPAPVAADNTTVLSLVPTDDDVTSPSDDDAPATTEVQPLASQPADESVSAADSQPTVDPAPADAVKEPETKDQPKEEDAHEAVKRTFRRVRRIERLKAHATRRFLWIFLTLLAVLVLVFFINLYNEAGEKEKNMSTGVDAEEIVEKKNKTANAEPDSVAPTAVADAPASAAPAASDAAAASSSAASTSNAAAASSGQKRPASYILQKGQSLTDVSLMFYGTKDSVMAIIHHNNFRNPDKVYVGTEIKLP